MRTASCSCGALSITAVGGPTRISVCHCQSCKRRTGSSFGVAVFFKMDCTEQTGTSATYRRMGDSGKPLEFHFCPDCGSTVFWLPAFRPGMIAVALGCFEASSQLVPSQSVYDDERHQWVRLDLPPSQ